MMTRLRGQAALSTRLLWRQAAPKPPQKVDYVGQVLPAAPINCNLPKKFLVKQCNSPFRRIPHDKGFALPLPLLHLSSHQELGISLHDPTPSTIVCFVHEIHGRLWYSGNKCHPPTQTLCSRCKLLSPSSVPPLTRGTRLQRVTNARIITQERDGGTRGTKSSTTNSRLEQRGASARVTHGALDLKIGMNREKSLFLKV